MSNNKISVINWLYSNRSFFAITLLTLALLSIYYSVIAKTDRIQMSSELESIENIDIKSTQISSDGGHRYEIFEYDHQITYYRFLELLDSPNPLFREVFSQQLQKFPQTFFFECPPVSLSTLSSTRFEFVLLPALLTMQPDPYSFQEHFANCVDGVVCFSNLGRDSRLISPCPISSKSVSRFPHFSAFLHNSDQPLIHTLLRKISTELRATLIEKEDSKLWLSTSGAGVAWLHIRIDATPKYYQYRPYKQA